MAGGQPLTSNGSTVLNGKSYINERFDAETGLQYLHARYYDPMLGRFLSPDTYDPDLAGVDFNRYPPATRGSVRAQIMVSYLVMLAGIGGNELTSPMEAKLGLKFQDLEAQTKSWRKAILYGDDRKAAMLSAGIFTEVERSQVAKETGHLKLQKCWQKVFYCFQYESEMPLRKCEVLATQIFDRKTC